MNTDERSISVIIPSRNEEFLGETIEDILKNIRGNTNIIVVLDGQWPVKPIKDNPKVTMLFFPESIGQRAATNRGVSLSNARYILKCDAHCAFDEGFDVKMMDAFERTGDNVIMVPVMRNLHVFDWVCEDGHRRYQGPSGVCTECGKETHKDIVWNPKRNPQSTSYCFDSTPHFQYNNEYKNEQKKQGDLVETMSLQGSCFMLTREKYWELNICDENFGSWGSQGIETSVKMRLSGGRVLVNKNTWYGHLFRTSGGDFGFPYPQSGRAVERAKKMSKDLFFGNKWPLQKYPLSSMVEQFMPVPGWSDEDYKNLKKAELQVERPGIYSIKNTKSGKVYIGSSVNLARRFGEHLRMLHRKDHENRYLQSAWNKYGEDSFTFNIEYFCSEEDLIVHEQRFIDDYKGKIGWRQMYNLNPEAASCLGKKHTQESLEKMSRQQSGEGNGFYGKKHSEESIQKMRESHKGCTAWNLGIPCSDETKAKIGQANTGKVRSEETKKKISEAFSKGEHPNCGKHLWEGKEHPRGMLGKHHSEEAKKAISEKHKEIARERDSEGKYIPAAPTVGIIYYTNNKLEPKLMKTAQDLITAGAKGKPIVSVSLKPIDFGKNIVMPEGTESGPVTMFKQILTALKALDTDIVFFTECDVLYHPSHFDFVPEKKDLCYYNNNVWQVRASDKFAVRFDCKRLSQLCGYRDMMIKHYEKRLKLCEEVGFSRKQGFEPGTHGRPERVDDLKSETWNSVEPNCDIRHDTNMTASRWRQDQFRSQRSCRNWAEGSIPEWAKDLI